MYTRRKEGSMRLSLILQKRETCPRLLLLWNLRCSTIRDSIGAEVTTSRISVTQ